MLGTRKPLRLRSACSECYAAKVRCSGEKYGCDRCRRNGLYCEYQVSMVGRAPKKRRTKASGQLQLPHPQESLTLQQLGLESSSSPRPVVSVSMPGDPPPAGNNNTIFAMEDFTAVSAETEINNLLSDLPDLPLVSPGATDPFWLATENLLPDPLPDIHGTSNSEGTWAASGPRQASLASSHTSGMFDKHTPGFLVQERTVESVQSRLAEQTDARVPPSYRDRSLVSHYPHAAALMRIIEYLEEQLQIPRVPIDKAMRLNRQAMAKVREASNTDEFRRCQSCPLLVATIMDLVVGLYELVILSIQRPADEGDTVSLPDQNHQRQSPFQHPAGTGEMPNDRIPDRPSAAIQSNRFSSSDVSNSIQMNKRSSGPRW